VTVWKKSFDCEHSVVVKRQRGNLRVAATAPTGEAASGDESPLHALQVAQEANAAAYRRAVQTSAPGDCWDYVILTAANEKQAQGYRQELALRHRAVGPTQAFFPAIQRSIVVPDPPGRRAGSGGATLGAVRTMMEQFRLKPSDLDRLRVLLIHSGGASQRLPAYSPLGKIFAPLPLLRPDGQIATLFDHLYLTLAGLPDRLGPGLLILAGDVFLLFDHRHVTTPQPGVTAISMRVDAELGRGHGVFVTGDGGRVTETLQKVSVETMRDRGAADEVGRVLIDTGLLFFDAERTKLLAKLAGVSAPAGKRGGDGKARVSPGMHERFNSQIDLYGDMTGALATSTRREAFLSGADVRPLRTELWRNLHGVPFRAMQVEGEFLHLGTTRQFRDAMIGQNPSPAAELFQQDVLTHSEWPLGAGRRVYHSVLLADERSSGALGVGSVVEHSILRAPSRVGNGSIVSQVIALRQPIELGDNLLLFQVPVRCEETGSKRKVKRRKNGGDDGGESEAPGCVRYVHVLCGVEDDFKGSYADGKCNYLNRPIDAWLRRHNVSPEEVWPGAAAKQQTLWNARLFVATDRRDAASVALAMAGDSAPGRPEVHAWRKSPRYSMAMLLEMADPVSLIEHREVVAAYLQASDLLDAVQRRQDVPADALLGHYSTVAAHDAAEQLLSEWAGQHFNDANLAVDQARAYWCAVQLLQRPDHPAPGEARERLDGVVQRAFAKVAEASEIGYRSIRVRESGNGRQAALPPNVEIVAASPVRLDLSGGWSDTPPYCFERGGHVVNVAIDLDSRPPVRATVRTIREPKIVLESHDLGRTVELSGGDCGAGDANVHDPFALHKVALDLAGLLPQAGLKRSAGPDRLRSFLRTLGNGLHVTTESRVPKGSGLGTSSILAATLLAALHKVRGRDASPGQLIEQTLLLEQRLSTGGGWQDQVGGIVGGAKSTVTAPGIPQRPVVEQLAMSDALYQELEDRLVVYYSGQQRLARDILRRVLGRWLGREPAVLQLMEGLKLSAFALRNALLKGQWPVVAREIARYWQMKKELYPGSTTPAIDVLFLELQDHYLAAGLAGAGGGGFAYFFCKTPAHAKRLRAMLGERSARPGSLGRVYDTQINRSGMSVTVERR